MDPENEYQVVYVTINGGGSADIISLDKSKTNYRITGLKNNTEYKLELGYREIMSDSTIEEITEDIVNVKTLKLQGSLKITKITEKEIFFNLKIDPDSSYDDAKISIYINGNKQNDFIKVDTLQALQQTGWTNSITITEEMKGKITLSLEDVKELQLKASTEIK